MAEKQLALVTGASSGIGATYARALAARGYEPILVARRAERLAALAGELGGAEVLMADLADPAGVGRVEARIAELGPLGFLVNAAGFGTVGRYVRVDLARQLEMVQLHVVAAMRLTRAALPAMIERRGGAIVNVASVTALVPLVGNATYSGTKAFLVAFSQALSQELTGSGVKVQALCPGFTYTEFHDTPEYARFQRSRIPGLLWMQPEAVVAASLKALQGSRPVCIPGLANRLLVWLGRNRLAAPLVGSALVQKRRPQA